MERRKRFISVVCAAIVSLSALAVQAGENHALSAAAKATVDGQFEAPDAAIQELPGLSINGAPISFLDHEGDIPPSFTVSPASLGGITSVTNFSGAFTREGQVWPFIMMGTDPKLGRKTTIPTPIIAVTLVLQNADLVTTTTVSADPFVPGTLASPNFQKFKYEHEGEGTQFADAVQRAEFNSVAKDNWHTNLAPSVVDHVTINVPRTVNVILNGKVTSVRTYFTGTAADGSVFVLLLDRFFNQAFFNVVVNGINANQLTTNALNVTLFPNTFLFSLSRTGGLGACCTLGFHTFFFDNVTPEPVWVTAYASWISPGIFGAGFEDVTALSHEISEAVNDPFLNNATPRWQFPGLPGQCQGNLETGDPVEVLANATFPVTLGKDDEGNNKTPSFTFHPQTEALLQWFDGAIPSDAIHGAYSYPDTTALTAPSIVCH
jgi:hypothetical protein